MLLRMIIKNIFLLLFSAMFGSVLYFGTMTFFLSFRKEDKGEHGHKQRMDDLVVKAFFKRDSSSVKGNFLHRLTHLVGSIKKIHLVGYITTISIIYLSCLNNIKFDIGTGISLNISDLIINVLFLEFIIWLIWLGFVKKD